MIQTVLSVLKDQLNEYFKIKTGHDDEHVKFLDSTQNDPISFANNAVTPFLINVSEDRVFRKPDQYVGVVRDGIRTRINPEIRIDLQILFVSKFGDYHQSLKFLSYVIKCFQVNRVYTPLNSPELSGDNIEKLILELVTLPLEEQNQVWHSLNTSYLPSVMYRARVLNYLDEESLAMANTNASQMQLKLQRMGGKA